MAGRCARQGDPGHVDVILSLEDGVLAFGGADGWRYAVTLSGVIALVYAVVYFFSGSRASEPESGSNDLFGHLRSSADCHERLG